MLYIQQGNQVHKLQIMSGQTQLGAWSLCKYWFSKSDKAELFASKAVLIQITA